MPNPTEYEGFFVLLAAVAIVYGILMFFMPFFIYRIRNESIATNQLLQEMTELLKTLNTRK